MKFSISNFFKSAKEKAYQFTGDSVKLGEFLSGTNSTDAFSANKNWVYVAVDKVSSSMSGIRFKLMKYSKGDDEEVFDGPIYEFLQKPHPRLTWKDFVYLNTAYKEIAGNAFWHYNKKDKTLIPLIPNKVTPIIDQGELVGYKYTNGIKAVAFPVDEVLHDRYPSPTNPFWGTAPLERIAEWVDTDAYASEFNRLFFINGAAFGGVIETDEESKQRIELIKLGLKRDHTGVKNAHKWAVLPRGSKFKEISQSMRDMQFAELDATYRDKILSAFGVPKTLVGLTTDVNRASAEASEYIYASYTLKPKVERFVDFLNNFVIPLFDQSGQYYIDYEDFVPINKEIEIKENESGLNRQQYLTINEVRGSKGLLPVKGGDTIYGNPMSIEIGQPEEPKVVKQADPIGDFIEKAVDIANKTVNKDAEAHKKFVARVEDYQLQLTNKVREFNLKQKNEVINKLSRITKAVAKSDLFDLDEQVGILVDFVTPLLKGLLTEQAIEEYMAQGFGGTFNMDALSVGSIISKSATRMAKSYNKTTADLLKKELNEGLREGEGLRDLTKRVEGIYEFSDSYRAGMVAHTESFYVANEASREAYRQSGVVKSIRWYTADSDACQYCQPLNGKVININEVFFKKGEVYEGSAGGKLNLDYRTIDVPPIHPNCRCFIRPEEISLDELSIDKDFINQLEDIVYGN